MEKGLGKPGPLDVTSYELCLLVNPSLGTESEGMRIVGGIVMDAVEASPHVYPRWKVFAVNLDTRASHLPPQRAGCRWGQAHALLNTGSQEDTLVHIRAHSNPIRGFEHATDFGNGPFECTGMVRQIEETCCQSSRGRISACLQMIQLVNNLRLLSLPSYRQR